MCASENVLIAKSVCHVTPANDDHVIYHVTCHVINLCDVECDCHVLCMYAAASTGGPGPRPSKYRKQ